MIVLPREIPRTILKLEALKNRLHPHHPKLPLIQVEYAKRKAGFQGEKSIDYYTSMLDQEKYDIYHGLRLKIGDKFSQVDTFIVSDTVSIITEIKNITGTIHFDKTNQLIRSINGNEEAFGDPFAQARIQKLQLTDWLQNHKFVPFPIVFLVALANSNAIVNSVNDLSDQRWKLCRGANILDKIQIYEKMFKTETIPPKERKRLRRVLLKNHTPQEINILQKYEISDEDLIKGVQCPACQSIPMVHIYGTWHCSNCQHKSKNAHEKMISDFFLLKGPTITNQKFREFAQLPSRNIATKLLAQMNLPSNGINKGKIYYSKNYNPKSLEQLDEANFSKSET